MKKLALREADPAVQTAKVEDLRSIREIKQRQAWPGHLVGRARLAVGTKSR